MELRPEDRFAIQQLYAGYNSAHDIGDAEDWADVFTDDGEYVPGLGPFAGQEIRGRDQLLAFQREPHSLRVRHWNPESMPLLRDKGDYIEGTCYCMVLDISKDPPSIVGHTTYTDELVKLGDGSWRIRARRSKRDQLPPASRSAAPPTRDVD